MSLLNSAPIPEPYRAPPSFHQPPPEFYRPLPTFVERIRKCFNPDKALSQFLNGPTEPPQELVDIIDRYNTKSREIDDRVAKYDDINEYDWYKTLNRELFKAFREYKGLKEYDHGWFIIVDNWLFVCRLFNWSNVSARAWLLDRHTSVLIKYRRLLTTDTFAKIVDELEGDNGVCHGNVIAKDSWGKLCK